MELRQLGRSSIEVTPIGLGAWQFSEAKSFNGWFWDFISKDETQKIIKSALDGGINWFDTAEAYGGGKSEKGLSRGLVENGIDDGEVIITTKWWPLFRFAGNITKTIDERLENLNPFTIDLYQIHQPWSFSFVSTQISKMADLADDDKIRSIGVSNFNQKRMRKADEVSSERGYPLVSNQVKYSLLDRSIETNSIMDTAEELNISIIAYSPLEQGLLTGKFHDNEELLDDRPFLRRWLLKRKLDESRELVDLLKQVADEVDGTPAQVALNWLINFHGDTVVAIPGASKESHVKENVRAMDVKLSKQQLQDIDEASQKFL